jgi:urease accessory protein
MSDGFPPAIMYCAAVLSPGEGVVAIERASGRSVVTRQAARGPLQLLVPRNHGDAVWVFLSSLGGGFVDGDSVALDVRIGAGAAAMLATQASTKVYRSVRGCAQEVHAEVGDGGLLVVLPDPVVCFAGARFSQSIDVQLGDGATLILVDAVTCGRAARGERWAFDAYRSAITVRRGERLLLHDAIELDAAAGALDARMGRFDALATLVGFGPRAELAPPPLPERAAGWLAARSELDGGALVRAAAADTEHLHAGIRAALTSLPALLGDDPFARKW